MSSSSTQNHSIQRPKNHVLSVPSQYRQRRSSTDELAALGTVADATTELSRPPTQNEINSLLASISEDSSEPEPVSSSRMHDSVSTYNPESHSIAAYQSTSLKHVSKDVNSSKIADTSPSSAAVSYSHTSSGMTSSAVSPAHPEAAALSSTSQACPVPLDLDRSRSVRGLSVQHDEDGSNGASVNSPPESIQAYALLDFENFTFYVQTMQILLGRMVDGDKSTDVLDIHLGPQKAISRRHAKIFYNFGHQRFEMTVLGRNGAFVDDTFVEQGVTLPLKNDTGIQIGETRFRFILPGEDGSMSSSATTPGAAEGERSSISNVAEVPMNPSQAADLKAAFTDEKKRSDKLMAGAIEGHSFSDEKGNRDKSSIEGNYTDNKLGDATTMVRSTFNAQDLKSSPQPLRNCDDQDHKSATDSRSTITQVTMLGLADAHEAQAKAIAENEAFAIKKGYLPANWQHQAVGDSAHQTQTQTQGGMAVSKISSNLLVNLSDAGNGSSSQMPKKEKRRSKKRIYKPEEIPEPYRQKPGYSYCTMIIECLKQRATPRGMTLSEIYEGIREMYPYYKFCSEGWRSSVRHNLSTNQCFRKVARDGKGWFWGLTESAEEREKQEIRKQKLKEERKRRHRQRQEELSKSSSLPQKDSLSSPSLHNGPSTDKKISTSTSSSKLSGDTKRALGYLQKELVRLTKDRKLYDRGTTTQILTQALAMTIAQVNQAAKNAGIKGSPLLTLIDKNPGHVTKILSAALNAATIQIARKKGLPVHLPPRNKAGSPTSKKQSALHAKSTNITVKKEVSVENSRSSSNGVSSGKVPTESAKDVIPGSSTTLKNASSASPHPIPHLLTPPNIKPMKPSSSSEMHKVGEQPAGIRKPKYYSKHSGPAMFRPISKPAPYMHDKEVGVKKVVQAKTLPSEFLKFAHPSPPVKFVKTQYENHDDGKVDKELDMMMKSLEDPAESGKKDDENVSGKRPSDEESDRLHKIQKK